MLRRALIAAVVCAAAGVLGTPAHAARPALPHSISTAHFVVHYTSDPTDTAYATMGQATTLAALAETAYATEVGWGFQAPLDDGDGKVDVYIQDLSGLEAVLAYASPDAAGTTSKGYIVFGVGGLDASDEGLTIAHELFHVIQYGTWASFATSDRWLVEGAAEWAAAKVYGFPASMVEATGPADLSLDCRDTVDGFQMCDPAAYVDGGYSRWPFLQSLAGRYGAGFLQSVFAQGATGLSAIDAVGAALNAKGGTLADAYGDWAVQQMSGGYGVPTLDAHAPTTYAAVSTGAKTGALPSISVPVDHLATRYLVLARGDGAADHPCFAATLSVTVTIPAGVTSRPFLYWNVKGSVPVPLTVVGNKASTTIPWDTCLWSGNVAYLALPNASTTVDAAAFVVEGSVTVDPNTPASATSAPDQDPVYGGVTPTSSAETPPAITVFGPLLLMVSAKSPTLRLIVESSGDGKVHTQLGSVDLGSPTLRAGNNDLRFKVPKTLLTALRRSAAAGNVLILTPLSPSGAVAGEAVTRHVAVAAAPAKHKAKKKK